MAIKRHKPEEIVAKLRQVSSSFSHRNPGGMRNRRSYIYVTLAG